MKANKERRLTSHVEPKQSGRAKKRTVCLFISPQQHALEQIPLWKGSAILGRLGSGTTVPGNRADLAKRPQ